MKKLKKLICSMLSALLIMNLSTTVLADGDSLSRIAEYTIQVNEDVDITGSLTTTFTNLDTFIDTVRENYPKIADYDIARFLMQYTQQDCEGLPEDVVLSILEYDNITVSTSYVRIDADGNSYALNDNCLPIDDYTSNDGYIKFTTTYSNTKTVGKQKYYNVFGSATWLKYPAMRLRDCFVVGTNGTFDDSVSEKGNVIQSFKCIRCGAITYKTRTVTKSKRVDNDLNLKYDSGVPELHFDALSTQKCSSCDGFTEDYSFTLFISYGVIASEAKNIQASYGHQTVGFKNDISVSISGDGTASLSASVGTLIETYTARPVTMKY